MVDLQLSRRRQPLGQLAANKRAIAEVFAKGLHILCQRFERRWQHTAHLAAEGRLVYFRFVSANSGSRFVWRFVRSRI